MTMKRLLLPVIVTAALAAAGFALATILSTCTANVCSNTVDIGGQDVTYSWTQNHNLTSSTLKVRFQSGPYTADANPVRFKVTSTKPFSSYAVLKNPSPTTALPSGQTVDVASMWIERSAAASTAGTTYDFTFELRYDNPAPGPMDLTIEIAQYGDAQTYAQTTVATQRVEFDAGSVTNRDEGEAFPNPPYGANYLECADGADNDFDYRLDCADSDCLGEPIQLGTPNRFCESPEVTCNDGLDNDGDTLTDCADPQCNGKAGNAAGDKFCGSENGGVNHLNCADGFDNDGNGKTDCSDDTSATGCWQTGFQDCAVTENTDALCTDNIDNDRDKNYDEGIDTNALTGIDCRDYDCKCEDDACAIVRHCPISERLKWDAGSFVDTSAQCLDGIDNDLDGKNDCADDDCIGAASCAQFEAYLPPAPLGSGEAGQNPSFYFNLCLDGIDNDGDGFVDALDTDCRNRFGACTPSGYDGLAAQENVNFLSCGDGRDNDLNGAIDCAENACRVSAMIGRAGCANATCGTPAAYTYVETDAAACAAVETGAAMCGDGIDNDADGSLDCSDTGCLGQPHGASLGGTSAGYVCGAEDTVAKCSDGDDNDSDGDVDCFDAQCHGIGACNQRPPAGWALAACVTVPSTTALAPIVTGGNTQYAHDDKIRASNPYRVRFTGVGSYTSLTIVLGDAVNPANAFPFDASAANCTLAGTGSAQMQYVSSDLAAGTIFNQFGETINGFDVTLTCANTSPVSTGPLTYAISIVSHHGATIEYGETFATVQVYENIAPTLTAPAIETEGEVGGQVNIPVGGTVRFQATPNADPSGICRCDFDLDGTPTASSDGNCTVESPAFVNDAPAYEIRTTATDGADNTSAQTAIQSIDINVIPSVSRNLFPSSSRTTYSGGMAIGLDTTFQTDTASTFAGACNVYVCTDAHACVLQGATVSMPGTGAGTSLLTCLGTYTPPVALSAGRYYVFVETTDSGGDTVRSNLIPFLKCEAGDAGSGPCVDADLDADGAPEGRFTPASYAVSPAAAPSAPDFAPFGSGSACDNCVNWPNATQRDKDANGFGDACEVGAIGRCQYKQCSNSGTACSNDGDCEEGNACIVAHQAMCARNCTVATEATDCAFDPDGEGPDGTLTGFCQVDWGVCEAPGADEGACCFNDADCGSNSCVALVAPFIETTGSQIYSAGDLAAGEAPPIANAAFCLQAGGTISNFTSALGCSLPGIAPYQQPRAGNNYAGSFGIIDVNGILNGKYGKLQSGVNLNAGPQFFLDGKIYHYAPGPAIGLTVTSPVMFKNTVGTARGNGLIVVIGDIHINGNLSYESTNADDLRRLASVGWVALRNPDVCPVGGDGAGCGNIIIDGSVDQIVGAFFAEGAIETGTSDVQLNATGMFLAKDIQFQRTFASRTGGAEVVNFDARVILNPPPGLSDLSRSLPGFQSVAGQ